MIGRGSLSVCVALALLACAQTSPSEQRTGSSGSMVVLLEAAPPAEARAGAAVATDAPVADDALRADARRLFPALQGDGPLPVQHLAPVDTRVVRDLSDYKQQRKAWVRERHRAPPDVDWQALEEENGAAQREKRNVLAGMAAAGVSRWTERGSENQAGRMHVAVPSPDGAALYAGSALGGVWRGAPDGTGWTPLGDNLDGGAHWLAVVPGASPGDPDVIVRGTDGGKVHRSTDGGATWLAPAGLPSTTNVRRLLTSSDGTHTIFLLVRRPDGGNELLRSTDRGASFVKVAGLSTYEGDAWMPRDGGSALYLLRNGNLWRSDDLGDTFSQIGSLPVAGQGAELVGSEAGAPRLWAIQLEAAGWRLYRSDDAGASWVQKAAVDDYWGSLAASIVDVDLFAWGGVEVHRTADGGDSFAIVNPWWEYYGDVANKLHADIPGLDVVPDGLGGEIWYVSTDGGLYESRDGLASVSNLSLSGLRVSQYYSTLTSSVNSNHVAAGSQDQGYQRAGAPPSSGSALAFDQLISGDYGHLTSGDGSHAFVFSVYPGFVLLHRKENDPDLYTTDFPPGELHSWLPAIHADPYDRRDLFFCASRLYKLKKNALLFTWTPQLWSNHDFQGTPGEHLTALDFSPVDPERAYAATNVGRRFRSLDHGLTWTPAPGSGPGAHYFYGTAVLASALDADTVYVGGSGYGNPAVFRSTDGGQSFQSWGQGLPPTLVYSLAEAPDGTVFAGTETAAYRRAPGDAAWIDVTDDDAPVTIYWSAELVPALDVIRFGTYGRGIWDYQLGPPCAYEAYGVGLGGNVLVLDSSTPPAIGAVHELLLSGGPANAPGFLILGAAPAAVPAYGGTLLVDLANALLIGVASDANGGFTLPLQAPNDPALVGITLHWQVALRTSVSPVDYAFSNGLLGTLCQP